MNEDIKNGAKLLIKGLKAEAENAKNMIQERLDTNCDGTIEFHEIEEEVIRDAKEGVAKLKTLAETDKMSKKVKAEIDEAVAKIKPMLEIVADDADEAPEDKPAEESDTDQAEV